MRRLILVVGIAVAIGGCASSQEWEDWKSHSSHFASGEHLSFSVKNRFRSGARGEVTSTDGKEATQDKWWGVHKIESGQDLSTPKD